MAVRRWKSIRNSEVLGRVYAFMGSQEPKKHRKQRGIGESICFLWRSGAGKAYETAEYWGKYMLLVVVRGWKSIRNSEVLGKVYAFMGSQEV